MADAENAGGTGRKRLWKWLDRALWVGVVALLLYRFGPQVGAAIGLGGENRPAPAFDLETLDGERVRLADLEGKVVLVNFWATWCPPCRAEMPWFEQLYRERAKDGFVVVGASLDRGSRESVQQFLRERNITYPVAIVPDALSRQFGSSNGLPTSYLIDRNGHIRYSVMGLFAEPALRAAVGRLLSEK